MTQHKSLDEMASEMVANHEGPLGKSFRATGVPQMQGPGGHVGSVMAAMGIEPQPDPREQDVQKSLIARTAMAAGVSPQDPRTVQKADGEGYQPTGDADTDRAVSTVTTVQSFHSVEQDVDTEGDEPEDSITRQHDMVARESGEKYVDYWRNEGEEATEHVPQVKKSLETSGLDALQESLEKAKYTKRTGTPGNYKYEYPDDKKPGKVGGKHEKKGTFPTQKEAMAYAKKLMGQGYTQSELGMSMVGDSWVVTGVQKEKKSGKKMTSKEANDLIRESVGKTGDGVSTNIGTDAAGASKKLAAMADGTRVTQYTSDGYGDVNMVKHNGKWVTDSEMTAHVDVMTDAPADSWGHVFTDKEMGTILADSAESGQWSGKVHVFKPTMSKAELSPAKAKKILHDKEVHGQPLTDKQRRYMGAVASGEAKKSMGDDVQTLSKGEAKMPGLTELSAWFQKAEKPSFADWMMKLMKKKEMSKATGGPYIGPRGGKWADPEHKVPWDEKRSQAGKKQKQAKEHDPHMATELALVVENESQLYNQIQSIQKNLVNKMASGKYDHAQAAKLWNYATDAGAKLYEKQYMGTGQKIPPADRAAAARKLSDEFHDMAKDGEFDHMLQKKYQPKPLNAKDKKALSAAARYGVASGGMDASSSTISKLYDAGLITHSKNNTMIYVPTEAGKEAMKTGNYKPKAKMEKSMSATEILEDYLEKSGAGGLPSHSHTSLKKPKSAAVDGGSADGGSLEGGGHGASEAPDLSSSQGRNPGSVQSDKLSEDDAEVEGQMKPHKKPIERTRKSLDPASQREMVAHEQAVAVSRLRKGQADVTISADERAAALAKSDGFYEGNTSPTLHLRQDVDLNTFQKCQACEHTFAKSLTSCPDCGYGQVGHRIAPGQYVGGDVSVRANYQPVLRKSQPEEDIDFGRPDPRFVHRY